jgi:hypothetical protein
VSASPPDPARGTVGSGRSAIRGGEGCRVVPGEIAFTSLADVRVLRRLGEGGRSTVYLGERAGRPVALKVYKPLAVLRHARKHPVPLARYEHERNRAFHEAPGLAPYVAEPIAFLQTDGVAATLQEPLDGQLYYFHHRETGGRDAGRLLGHLQRILDLAHAARLHDVDMHSMNVMVVRGPDGLPWPKLFDFNLIPFDVRPPNPVVALLLRTGLMGVRHRDQRKLRDFHDFRRVERKLLRFYEGPPDGTPGS